MSRLFTFGCSYTHYAWPSWADFLGLEFTQHENWGYLGLGNRAIAERVAECNVKNKFTPDDVIIVQWSSHLRNDYHTERRRINYHQAGPFVAQGGWKTGGSMFNYINNTIYDNQWVNQFFDEKSYFLHTLNNISLTQGLLKSTGARWYMTSMADLDALGTDIGILHGENINKASTGYSVWQDSRYESLWDYKTSIWGDYADMWLPSLGPYVWKTFPDLQWSFKDPNSPRLVFPELHPSPRQHAAYVKDVIRPRLNLNSDTTDLYTPWFELTDKAKELAPDLKTCDSMLAQYWNLPYMGI